VEGGEIALTQEGGHSHRRIVHALGDATGKEVMRAMLAELRKRPNVQIWERTFTIDLLTHDGVCRGAIVWNPQHGKTIVWAKQTILATGGAGRLYRETTNPEIATGDGHAIAFRAGAEVRDMEFMQFHPTVLYIAGSSRHLITEAARGEGAYLRDSTGYRFMRDYHPAGELAPRDDVSRAITSQMAKTRHGSVYLDLSHLPPGLVRERFPHIGKVCADFGLDITRDLIPVCPGAHYMIGGLTVDIQGRTTLPGLWAAGEVTSSGLHGANRLASNSLLEGLVFGLSTGQGAANQAKTLPDQFAALPILSGLSEKPHEEKELNLADVRNALTSLMWRNVGIRRQEDGLKEAADQVNFWDRYVSLREFSTPPGWELQNMLLVARLMIASATERRESRGVHYRSDYPETLAEAKHIAIVATGSP
jgi:L-aspartate oxidase